MAETKLYERACGCSHAGKGHTWKRCRVHAHQEEVEALLISTFGKPECPEGCGDVRRPKCMWESSDCPRHDVKRTWDALLRAAVRHTENDDG